MFGRAGLGHAREQRRVADDLAAGERDRAGVGQGARAFEIGRPPGLVRPGRELGPGGNVRHRLGIDRVGGRREVGPLAETCYVNPGRRRHRRARRRDRQDGLDLAPELLKTTAESEPEALRAEDAAPEPLVLERPRVGGESLVEPRADSLAASLGKHARDGVERGLH